MRGGGMPPVSEVELGLAEEGSSGLTRADCQCPVCLNIFLEPVTLPCAHTFCKPCFLETVDKSNMCCPLCRKRVSTWARLNVRNRTLVNVELWRRIQDAFPTQCQRRLSGLEDDDASIQIPRPKVCQPGELRREYEDQISKLVEEKRALEEAERKASEEYIQRLLAEEEERLAEERRTQEERQLEDDEKLARLLSQELNPSPISESQRNVKPNDITSAKKKQPNAGDIEKFLSPVRYRHPSSSESSPTSSLVANKENILNPPVAPLSSRAGDAPADQALPVLDYYGRAESSRSFINLTAPISGTEPPGSARGASHPSAKRKSPDTEPDGEGDSLRKRPRAPVSPPPEGPLLQELAQREQALFSRLQQEEEDRQLALRLQRQLNREEAQHAVDRSKSSADPYQLRQKASPPQSSVAGPSTEEAPRRGRRLSMTSPQGEGKTPKSSASAMPISVTPLNKGSKQTTLTEMFPNLSS